MVVSKRNYKCFCYKTSDSLKFYLLSTFDKKLALVKFKKNPYDFVRQ